MSNTLNALYVRLFTDEQGESHFKELSSELQKVEFAPDIPPLFVSDSFPAIESTFFGAPSGWESNWHPSSGRHLFAVLSGIWEVTASDGETRTFGAGEVLLVEDTSGKGHRSRVISAEDSLAVLVKLPDLS